MEPSSLGTSPLLERHFTQDKEGTFSALDGIEWTRRTARVGDFTQENVEAPGSWSDNAVGIAAKLYFATVDGVRENSVRKMIERVAYKITQEGIEHGYFPNSQPLYADATTPFAYIGEAEDFYQELCYLLVNQMVAFNTPVWLNVGVPGRPQCCSACFLLPVEDRMHGKGEEFDPHSITGWWTVESRIFKMGAGSGVNVSKLRGSMETLSTGGIASGPLSYMRAADAGAGTLKSGGAHRRAAKMVIENVDHPDIEDFIDSKRREDQRMRDLAEAGHEINPFTPSGEKTIAETTSFQNANISVGASNEFMERVASSPIALARVGPKGLWSLTERTTGKVVKSVSAHELMDDIVDAAWRCGDPGMVFLDTANVWHTTPSLGPITTCNPCAETWLNDDSSCNLASLNLLRFLDYEGNLRVEDFQRAVDVMVLAMDITCSFSDLPTPEITRNTRELRQLGLGYSNLGAALMAQAMPYESNAAQDWAASVTALMTGRAYRRSGELAERFGGYDRFADNRNSHLGVIRRHCEYLSMASDIWKTARSDWDEAKRLGKLYGFRNSQVTVLAPCGTISYLMDCDTTGVEPDFALVKYKGIAGGGNMTIVNKTIYRALDRLAYPTEDIEVIVRDLETTGVLAVNSDHMDVFACANEISPKGHLRMVAAVQPFLSGAASKTINLPNSATPGDIKDIYVEAWKSGCKAVSVYRDGSKATQVLTSKPKVTAEKAASFIALGSELLDTEDPNETVAAMKEVLGEFTTTSTPEPVRNRLPLTRESITHKFAVGGHEGYITAGKYADGTLGEFFLTGVGKEGSFVSGMMSVWSIACSIDFQYGVPVEVMARKFIGMEFEPNGFTGNPEIPHAKSIPDYVFKWLVARFCDTETCENFGVLTPDVKARMVARLDAAVPPQETPSLVVVPVPTAVVATNGHAPDIGGRVCQDCGGLMVRSGSCETCTSCGVTSGCG